MEKQGKKPKDRVLIQFWVDPAEKERAKKFIDHHGQLAHIARQAFKKELERLEQISQQSEKLAS